MSYFASSKTTSRTPSRNTLTQMWTRARRIDRGPAIGMQWNGGFRLSFMNMRSTRLGGEPVRYKPNVGMVPDRVRSGTPEYHSRYNTAEPTRRFLNRLFPPSAFSIFPIFSVELISDVFRQFSGLRFRALRHRCTTYLLE